VLENGWSHQAARWHYALGVYMFVRPGELKAPDWSDVDMERGIVSIRVAWDRETDQVKQTKTAIRASAASPSNRTSYRCCA